MKVFLIHSEDLTYLEEVFGATWPMWKPLLFREAPVYKPKSNWKDLGYPVIFDGQAFQEYCRAVSALYFLFQRFQKTVKRWPRVFILGPRGGLKKLSYDFIKLESDKCLENKEVAYGDNS